MKVFTVGYVKHNKLERDAKRWTAKLFVKLLSNKSQKKIRRVRLTFLKTAMPRRNWTKGYHWLVQGDTVEIKINPEYRPNLKWLIAHELAHVEQIVSGKLHRGVLRPRYVNSSYRWNPKRGGYTRVGDRKFFSVKKVTLPWEQNANKKAGKAMKWVR